MIPAFPPTSRGVTYSPTVGMKTIRNAAAIPGRLSGSVPPLDRRDGAARGPRCPGRAERQRDAPELLERARVQVRGRVVEPRVDPTEDGQDRQGRERDPD